MHSKHTMLSVVVPVFQEQEVLPRTLSAIAAVVAAITPHYEIIVVDDGSRDASFETVAGLRAHDTRLKVIRLSRRFGKEAALAAGLCRAAGEAIITLDGDLQHPPEAIPEFVNRWRDGAQIVHGVKRDPYHAGVFHRLAARFFNALFARICGFDMVGSSDFKLLDARVARLLVERFPEHDRFMRGLTTWIGFKQTTVTYTVQPRSAGESRWRIWDLMRYGWNALTAFTSVPLQLVPLLGLVMLVTALLLGGEALVSRLQGGAVSGFATLEITVLFTGSLIMIGLGVIGQYLSRIYDELKRRPLFLVDREIGFDPPESR